VLQQLANLPAGFYRPFQHYLDKKEQAFSDINYELSEADNCVRKIWRLTFEAQINGGRDHFPAIELQER
jgi:hypothetical protein